MSAAGKHFLNDYDVFTTWGVVVSFGSAAALAMPKAKPILSNDWAELDGTEYFNERPNFEDKKVTLQVGFVAETASQLHINRANFFQQLTRPGWQKWRMVDNSTTYSVRYVEEQNLRKPFGPLLKQSGLKALQSQLDLIIATDFEGLEPEPEPLDLELTSSNVTSFGGSNGSITAKGRGGSGTYNYKLDNEDWTANKTGDHVFSNLPKGTYVVNVRDANDIASSLFKSKTITEPIGTPASATLTISKATGVQGTPEFITLNWGIIQGNEINFSERVIEHKSGNTNNVWATWNQPTGGLSGVSPTYTATINTDFRFKFRSESGVKESPIRSIVFSAPPIVVQYTWLTQNPYAYLSTSDDNLTYQGSVTLASNTAPIISDMRQGDMKFLVWKVPSGVTDKTLWNDGFLDGTTFTPGGFNYGTIPDTVFYNILTKNGFKYYITQSETATSQALNSRFRLS